jgi:hypothetical protein
MPKTSETKASRNNRCGSVRGELLPSRLSRNLILTRWHGASHGCTKRLTTRSWLACSSSNQACTESHQPNRQRSGLKTQRASRGKDDPFGRVLDLHHRCPRLLRPTVSIRAEMARSDKASPRRFADHRNCEKTRPSERRNCKCEVVLQRYIK